MWGPDIDVVVICKNPREASVKAINKIIDLRLFQKFEYGDFVKFIREHRPESYIVNGLLPFNGQKWEVETWFFDKYPDNLKEIDELIDDKLNEDNKKIILEMKKKRDEDGETKYGLSSTEIYKKVLGN